MALTLGLLTALPLSAFADSSTKAPVGSRDNEIKIFSFCLGQSSTRAQKLADSIDSWPAEASGYLATKSASIFKHMNFMHRATLATVNSVENPDQNIFFNSKEMGEKKGAEMFALEDKCLRTCVKSSEQEELSSCVDTCTKQQDPKLDAMIRVCDTVIAGLQAALASGKHRK